MYLKKIFTEILSLRKSLDLPDGKFESVHLAESLLVREGGDVLAEALEGVIDALHPPPLPHVGGVPHLHLVLECFPLDSPGRLSRLTDSELAAAVPTVAPGLVEPLSQQEVESLRLHELRPEAGHVGSVWGGGEVAVLHCGDDHLHQVFLHLSPHHC